MDLARKEPYRCKFCHAIRKIQQKYKYSYWRGALLVQDMLKMLAGLDELRNLRDAPAPSNIHGSANAVARSFSRLQRMIHKADTSGDESATTAAYKTAYSATPSNKKSLADTKACR